PAAAQERDKLNIGEPRSNGNPDTKMLPWFGKTRRRLPVRPPQFSWVLRFEHMQLLDLTFGCRHGGGHSDAAAFTLPRSHQPGFDERCQLTTARPLAGS